MEASNAWSTVLADMGLGDSDPGARRVEYLWPDNLPAWRAWCAVQTQWRVGPGGPTGLDYAGVSAWLTIQEPDADRRRELFAGVQAAEGATLEVWSERRERERQAS